MYVTTIISVHHYDQLGKNLLNGDNYYKVLNGDFSNSMQ